MHEEMADLVHEVNLRPGENTIDWTVAIFKGKNKMIDMSLQKSGVLLVTNQRVVFRGGVVLGYGFKKEISVPFANIQKIQSQRKLLKEKYRKLLILEWAGQNGNGSAVFFPYDSKSTAGGMVKSLTKSIDPRRKGLAEEWQGKIKNAMNQYGGAQQNQGAPTGQQTPPPPPPSENNENSCPDCDEEMRYIDQYDRWYCDNCQQYK